MISNALTPGLAIVGLVGFESLKIYKRIWAGQHPIPKQRLEYFSVLISLALFVGAVGFATSPDTAIKAIFLGFAIPASVKAIFDPVAHDFSVADSHDCVGEEDKVEDIAVVVSPVRSTLSYSKATYRAIEYYFYT